MNNNEIKIFLTFFLIFSYFIQWTSWNEESRFALTRSIVEEGRFEIDSFANQTGDRAYYKNHYYTDKAPGLSFLSLSIHTILRLVCYSIYPQSVILSYFDSNSSLVYFMNSVPLSYNPNPSFFIRNSMVWITVFTSSLLSSLTALLIYRISRYFTKTEKFRLLVTFTYGFGTLAFPYAMVFLNHATLAFFTFLSFYLLFKMKNEKITNNKYFFLVGIFLGFLAVIEYLGILISLFFLVYAILINKKKFYCILISYLMAISP